MLKINVMPRTKVHYKNINCPEPRWFRRLRNAVSDASNTAAILLVAMGYEEDSFTILCVRIGISGIMRFIGLLLSDKEI